MRKSIDGLMSLIKDTFDLDPFANAIYLFCGRRCDRLRESGTGALNESKAKPKLEFSAIGLGEDA